MKKIYIVLTAVLLAGMALQAQQPQEQRAPQGRLPVYMQPDKEQRKAFKQRGKQIRRLVKQYRKAKSSEEKAAIKEQLAQLVSQATDAGNAWALARVAAEKENLIRWEQKLQEQQAHLDEIKARRVEELLSGEAEQRFKLARKRWKKELQDFKKSMK